MRTRTTLGSIGDPLSELNIQRRVRWFLERKPKNKVRFSKEQAKADPAIEIAARKVDWLIIE